MEYSDFFSNLVHKTTTETAQKIAAITFYDSTPIPLEGTHNFTVYTLGSYRFILIFYMESVLMQKIADQMGRKHIELNDDIVMYNQEFFNILCGNIISRINRKFKRSARFNIPQFDKNEQALTSTYLFSLKAMGGCMNVHAVLDDLVFSN